MAADEVSGHPCSCELRLDPAHENEDQQDHDNKAQTAAAIIAGTIERAATNAADTAQKNKN
jgi:hypothetical protein